MGGSFDGLLLLLFLFCFLLLLFGVFWWGLGDFVVLVSTVIRMKTFTCDVWLQAESNCFVQQAM